MDSSKKRFYDEDPTVSQAVEALFIFPDEIQSIIAQAFAKIAERDCNAAEILKEFRTLGSERVLALYKSKKKQRKYDKNPTVHNAMNYLMVMDEKSRRFLATKVIELIGFMQTYFGVCRQHSTSPELSAIEAIAGAYAENGPAAAKTFLTTLEEELKNRVFILQQNAPKKEAPAQAPPSDPSQAKSSAADKSLIEGIESQSAGMRIKGDLI
jgi:hypothetical protein